MRYDETSLLFYAWSNNFSKIPGDHPANTISIEFDQNVECSSLK